jgi:hypothetical protein
MTLHTPAGVSKVRSSQEHAIASGATHIGDIVSYDATALRIQRTELGELFETHGHTDLIPATIEPSVALSRAAGKPLPKGLMTKAFGKPKKDTSYAVGVYVLVPKDGEAGDAFQCGARVRIENGSAVALPPEGEAPVSECLEVAERIAKDANELIHYAETTDVTAAVVSVITGPYRGIAMRRRGGVYFVRPEFSAPWQALALGLAKYGFKDLSYPMAGDGRSQKAAAHMVRHSLEQELADLRKQLSELDSGTRGTRDSTVEKRVADCEALVSKAELYESILGDWLGEVRSGIDRVKGAFERREKLEADDLFAPLVGGDTGDVLLEPSEMPEAKGYSVR